MVGMRKLNIKYFECLSNFYKMKNKFENNFYICLNCLNIKIYNNS